MTDELLRGLDSIEQSFHDEVTESYEISKFQSRVALSKTLIAGYATEIVSKAGEVSGRIQRDVLPEPWDIPDHVGNFTEGVLYTTFLFSVSRFALLRRNHDNESEDLVAQEAVTNKKAAAVAFLGSSIIQVVGEKYGVMNTGDMTDAAYGIGFSGLAALYLNSAHNKITRKREARIEKSEERAEAEIEEYKASRSRTLLRDTVKTRSTKNAQNIGAGQGTNLNKKKQRRQQKNSRRKNRK